MNIRVKKVFTFILIYAVTTATLIPPSCITANAVSKSVETLESYSNPGYYVCHNNFAGIISPNPAPIYDCYFVEKGGMADFSDISLESVNYPGYYLRHRNFVLMLEKDDGTATFKQDATFKRVPGLGNSKYSSFQSYNYSACYIRCQNKKLELTTISSSSDKMDATFKRVTYNNTFSNPRDSLNQRPDPFVYKNSDGYYYGLCTSQDSSGYVPQITMWKSKSLNNLYTTGTAKTIWKASSSGWNSTNVWAPELYHMNGVWYIYYSAGYRIGTLSNTSSDPLLGTWMDSGRISPNEWAIDGTILNQNGSTYLIYSHYDSSIGQVLKICKMKNPTSLIGTPIQISAPTYSWEKNGGAVNEGPEILQRNGKTFCIYSASSCATEFYCLGMLSISNGADPMVPKNWTKFSNPLMRESIEDGIYGTGHCSFTKSPDGREDWIVYHATTIASNSYQPRFVCMQRFAWNSDGTPNLWQPCGRLNVLPKPSGE